MNRPIEAALDKVRRLHGVSFDSNETGEHHIGLIAEEVYEVVPEVVLLGENGKDVEALDYGRLVAVLVEAVKEQQQHIKVLHAANIYFFLGSVSMS